MVKIFKKDKKMNKYLLSSLAVSIAILCLSCIQINTISAEKVNPESENHSSIKSAQSTSVQTFQPIKKLNLISNSDVESSDSSSQLPKDWNHDSWGENSASFSWGEKDAYSGSRYLITKVSDYKSGDAKWVHSPQNLKPGNWYEYSSYYRSDGRSRLIWSCNDRISNKKFYRTSEQSPPSATWRMISFRFYVPQNHQCESSIFHVLDRNGYLHTDQHQLIETVAHPFKEAMVSITFDDIWERAVTIGASELDKRELKGTYYISKKLTQNPQGKYANIEHVKQLVSSGHEVSSHTLSHGALSRMPESQHENEFAENLTFLKQLGANSVGLAYPLGDFTDKINLKAQRHHQYIRTSLMGLNDKKTSKYRLRILPVTKETTPEHILQWVKDAQQTSSWLILLYHDLGDDDGREPNYYYLTPQAEFSKTLDYIKSSKVKVLTVEDALKQGEMF